MKAVAVFPGTREIKLIEHMAPKVSSPTAAMLRLLDVGICGTDREITAFEYGTPPPGSPYLVIGHESLAEVIEAGPGVSRVMVGDLVVPMVRRPCHHKHCLACSSGRQDFCYTGDFTERGIKGAHGFMTEFAAEEDAYLNVVPHDLREVGVLVEPLTIAEKALAQIWDVQERLPWARPAVEGKLPGSSRAAVVLGAGPVGLLGAMVLANAGFTTCVYSREEAPNPRADIVTAIGCTYISSTSHSVEQLAKQVGSIDVVYEAVGASRLAFDVIRVLGTNGLFVFTGVPGRKAPVEVDTDLLMRNLVLKNQVLVGTVNAGRESYERAIRDLGIFLRRWPHAVRSLIGGRSPIDAYSDLLGGTRSGLKQVISLH